MTTNSSRIRKVHLEDEKILRQRLEQLERDNAENTQPVEACFRLDAGFGTYENIALLIEMGYEVYIKLHNHKITCHRNAKTKKFSRNHLDARG